MEYCIFNFFKLYYITVVLSQRTLQQQCAKVLCLLYNRRRGSMGGWNAVILGRVMPYDVILPSSAISYTYKHHCCRWVICILHRTGHWVCDNFQALWQRANVVWLQWHTRTCTLYSMSLNSSMWRKLSSNRGKWSKFSSHKAKH